MDLAPKDLAAMDSAYWAVLNNIRLVSGVFTLQDHGYQLEPMQSRARRTCHMKATQGGFSELEILKALHSLIHRRCPQGVLYLFPTNDDMLDFSKSRFGPLIAANPESIGRFVRSGKKGTDAAGLKCVHGAFLFLRGARLTQALESGGDGQKESGKLRSVPVDRVVYDEWDLMDETVAGKARGRMGHSRLKEEVFIGNPTMPDYGIAKVFQTSDQRHLFRACSCGGRTCAETSFPECVKIRDDGTGYIACEKCGKPIGIEKTEWVPAERGNSSFMHGYRWSQLSSVFNDPAEILAEYNDPPEGKLENTYNLRLGLPYVAAENRLSVGVVKECCGGDCMLAKYSGPCAMGVDIGREFHVVIGPRTGKDRFQSVKLIRIPCAASQVTMESAWRTLHDLARAFNVRSAVVDIRPYEHEARKFQKEEPYRVSLCQYDENRVLAARYDDVEGIVRINRTEICDATHQLIVEKRLVLPRDCPEVSEFASQCCNTAKKLETNKKTGAKIFRYVKLSKDDHYRHALNYFLLAASGSRVARVGAARNRPTHAKSAYAMI